VIRFSVALVVIAVAVLIGGIAASMLPLVYAAIVLSAAALIVLAIGVARKRDELFGGNGRPVGDVMGSAAGQPYLSGQSGGYPSGQGYQGYTGQQSFSGQGYTGQPAPGARDNSGMSGGYGTASAPSGGYGPGGTPAPGPASPPSAPRVTSTPGRSAPLPSSRSVTQTRADLQALPDTPQPGSPSRPGAPQGPAGTQDADETRTDLPPVRPDGPPPGGSLPSASTGARTASTGSRTAGADETRLDMAPILDDNDLKDKVVSSQPTSGAATPSAAPSGGLSRSPETRADLPAQPDTAGRYETPAPPSMPEPKPMTGDSQVAVIPGVPRYHAPGCILIRFMDSEDLELKTLDEAKAGGCTPCTACQAD